MELEFWESFLIHLYYIFGCGVNDCMGSVKSRDVEKCWYEIIIGDG